VEVAQVPLNSCTGVLSFAGNFHAQSRNAFPSQPVLGMNLKKAVKDFSTGFMMLSIYAAILPLAFSSGSRTIFGNSSTALMSFYQKSASVFMISAMAVVSKVKSTEVSPMATGMVAGTLPSAALIVSATPELYPAGGVIAAIAAASAAMAASISRVRDAPTPATIDSASALIAAD